jgi:hypothetical protein
MERRILPIKTWPIQLTAHIHAWFGPIGELYTHGSLYSIFLGLMGFHIGIGTWGGHPASEIDEDEPKLGCSKIFYFADGKYLDRKRWRLMEWNGPGRSQ